MHILSLFVEGVATPFQLRYRGPETAGAAMKRVRDARAAPAETAVQEMCLADDYGQQVSLLPWQIKVVVLQDIKQDLGAQVMLAKMQSAAQQEAMGGSGLIQPRPGMRQ